MPKEVRASSSYMQRVPPLVLPSDLGSAARSTANWSAEDDETLMNARAAGMNWQPIAAQYFPTKTANACRKRHERLMDRRNAQDWDGVKLETLAQAYMEVRREIWQPLANRVGEKWGLVEAKCMEKGLKNLQAAHRSAQRRERGMDGDDSGIGFSSDAEHEIVDDEPPAPVSYAHYPPYQPVPMYHQAPYHRPSVSGGSTGRLSIQAMLSPSPSAVVHC